MISFNSQGFGAKLALDFLFVAIFEIIALRHQFNES
jgi:hypothetical protein